MEGKLCLYKVLEPDRATLEVCVVNGVPRVGQLKGVKNQSPTDRCRETVRNWMKAAIPGTNVEEASDAAEPADI